MSQSSLVIENGTGLSVRTAINSALDALATDFSGDNAPTSPVADQLWRDTSTSPATMRRRNANNTGWDVEYYAGGGGGGSGGTSSPELLFDSDTGFVPGETLYLNLGAILFDSQSDFFVCFDGVVQSANEYSYETEIVDDIETSRISFSTPIPVGVSIVAVVPKGAPGPAGVAGDAATVAIGTVTTVEPEEEASVTNSGTNTAAVLDFNIPKGDKGDTGATPYVTAGTTTTLGAGESATVTNVGEAPNVVLNFGIPQGPGGAAATIAIGTVTTLPAGGTATVTNSGTSSAAVFDFSIPQGYDGNGAGDLVSTNNLSDLQSASTALTNLGGTTVGKAVFTATDAAAARSAIGAGTSNFDGAYESLSGKPTLGTAAAASTADFATANHTHTAYAQQYMVVALSDEGTAITAGTSKVTMRAPFAMTLYQIPRASLSTASTSGLPTVDINVGGATILSTKLTIDANEKTSTTAATPAVLSTTTVSDDAEITFDIDVAGTGAKGLKVTLYYTRA